MATGGERAVDDLPHTLGAFIGRAGETAEIVSFYTAYHLYQIQTFVSRGRTYVLVAML